MSVSLEVSHLATVVVIWALLLLLLVYKLFVHCFSGNGRPFHIIPQKGILPTDVRKDHPKYLLSAIFSGPTRDFKMKSTAITVFVLRTGATKMFKIASFVIDCSQMKVNTDWCCLTDYRYTVMSVRKQSFPPITHVRAIHNGQGDSKIFLDGIEVIDQMSGERRFYAIEQTIINSSVKNAKVMEVKPQKLRFFAKETFCPTFCCLSFETIGVNIKTADLRVGIRVQPKLNWFETWVLLTLLVNLTFTIMTALIRFMETLLKDNSLVLVLVSAIISSLSGLLVTEMVAFIYRFAIKSQYIKKCSQMKVILKQSSTFWELFRAFSLFAILGASVLSSLLVYFLILKDINTSKMLKIRSFGETLILLLLLLLCLSIAFTIGIFVFGVVRYLFRLVTFKRGESNDSEKNLDFSELSDTSNPSSTSDKVVERKDRGQSLEQIKNATQKEKGPSTRTEDSHKEKSLNENQHKSSYDSKGYAKSGQKLTFNTDRLDKEATDKEKTKRLATKSLISGATQSKGYENPEDFRLTHSQIDKEIQQKDKKKKK